MTDHGSPEASASLTVHVVTHTHWDREWYQPAARFRQRLVALVDELLDDPPAPGSSFLLDGQTVLLEDYLEVRPDHRARLAELLRDGRIEAGPWYVLADELIPSGEALARNLLAGRQALRAFGAESPKVLYCPDSFGHPARLPTLAREFGFPLIILWRGYGGARWPASDAARWRAHDGAEVLLVHLPPDGYEFGSNLPLDPAHAASRWATIRETLAPRSALGVVLLPNGADHHARQQGLGRALEALQRAAAPVPVLAGSLRGFADAAVQRAATTSLPEVRGELRDSYGYTWTLPGTLASRASQKRRNAAVERLLVRETEPWSALARRHARIRFDHHVAAAWRSLLRVHPHDTLCGCVPDEVARAADARLDSAHTQAAGIRDDALAALLDHDPARARERVPMWRPVLVVRNPAARARGGVAQVELLAKVIDVPVGPGSARSDGKTRPRTHGDLLLSDASVPLQVLERSERFDLVESPRHYPDCDLVEVRQALVWIPPVPGYGTRSYDILAERFVRPEGSEPEVPSAVRADGLRLSNGSFQVACDETGRIALTGGDGSRRDDVLGFEHYADRGDLYTPSLRGNAITSARLRKQRLLHRGPLRAAIEQQWTLRVPRSAGARRPVEIPITCVISLDAGAAFARVAVSGENTAADHRLRILFRSGINAPRVRADAAFGPVKRERIVISAADAAMERALHTAPLHRWVAVHDDARSFAVVSDGLAEYEALEDGTVAITLVRGVGELARADLPERPGRAGWPVETPEAQCLGEFSAAFALMPGAALTESASVALEHAADDVLLPLTGATLRSALRLPAATDGVELAGEGLVFSAAKDSADGEWTVLRCLNLLDCETSGRWVLGFTATEARASRLDETAGDPLEIASSTITFRAGARAVSTILVR